MQCVKRELLEDNTLTHTHTLMHTPRKVEQLLLYFCHIQSHQSEAGTMSDDGVHRLTGQLVNPN